MSIEQIALSLTIALIESGAVPRSEDIVETGETVATLYNSIMLDIMPYSKSRTQG